MNRPEHLDETITVFELLDAQPELEADGVSPAEQMKGNALPEGYDEIIESEEDITARDIQESGGELYYHHEADGWFTIIGDYSPDASLEDGLVMKAHLSPDEQALEGAVVEEAYRDIVRATPAPYLEHGVPDDELEQHVAAGSVGDLQVPADYDQAALERSVETAVQRLSAAAALHDGFGEMAAEYAEEVAGGDTYRE